MSYRTINIYFSTIPFLLLLLLQSAHPAQFGNNESAAPAVMPNVVVMALHDAPRDARLLRKTGHADLDALLQQYGISHLEKLPIREQSGLFKTRSSTRIDNIFFAHYYTPLSPYETAAALQKHPAVEFAEPKYIRSLYAAPNDSLLWQQYHLNLIQAAQAWDIVKGEDGDVVIAIVDGGTDIYHPDLYANLWKNPHENPGNNLDDDLNGYIDDVHGARMADKSGDPTRPSYLTGYGAHGTHTAGIASAVTDNGKGVAGVSWNAKIMAVHAGSITVESQIPYGFEGILYAAENGAKVISCSWGGSSRSEYEARVVEYVNELGAVIVAAYGNDGFATEAQYPAAYHGVCSVAATDRYDRKSSFSSYGYSVDVCAPGSNIFSLYPANEYGFMSGTSMATPVAAGIISLILSQNPSWSGVQAAEQLRVTADNIDHLNAYYAGKLGRGRVNAYRALNESWPSIRIEQVAVVDQDSLIKPGETIKISLRLKNYLTAAQDILLTLSESSGYAQMTTATASIASLAAGQEITLQEAFEFKVAGNTASGHVLSFTLTIATGSFRDVDHFSLVVLPSFANISINHISTTVTNIGRIGFGDPGSSDNGIGFKYFNGTNLLFEGAVIAGTGPDRLVNAARGLIVGGQQPSDQDFTAAADGDLIINTPGSISDQETIAAFTDVTASTPVNIHIIQQTYALNREPFKDIILLRYTVRNQSMNSLSNFHFGLFFDWDMDGGTFATNLADFDPSRRLGYVYDTGSGPDTYVGVQLLTPGDISYRAIYNDHAHPGNPGWGLHDGFTDTEKWQSISGGLTQTKAGPADISNVIAGGPYTIAPHATVQMDFALVAGISLQQLQQNADAAMQMYLLLFSTNVEQPATSVPPFEYSLSQNYPNPFNDSATIEYATAAAGKIELAIFDLQGKRIRTLANGHMPAGYHKTVWDGRDDAGRAVGSGAYFYHLRTENGIKHSGKLILLR